MSIFGNKKSQSSTPQKITSARINSSTLIASSMVVTGDFKGTDSMQVEGKIIGDVSVNNTLIIGQSGSIEGNITANTVIINGELKGTIKCDSLEVMKTGIVSKHINAKNISIDGNVTGEVIGHERIDVLENSIIETTNMECETISVHGKVHGKVIASKILEIGEKGFVEGEITVKNIRTEEGGRMIGTMSTYQEITPVAPKAKKVTPKKEVSEAPKETTEDDFFESK